MKAASVNEIKQELQTLPAKKLLEVCLRLAKFKIENKELLSYLLFEAHNEPGYVNDIKNELDEQFELINTTNWYLGKKGLRKMLRSINKYSKYTADKVSHVEMLLHFCQKLKASGIPVERHKALSSLYEMQIKKLKGLIDAVHEDLRFDYQRQLEALIGVEEEEVEHISLTKVVNMFRGKKKH